VQTRSDVAANTIIMANLSSIHAEMVAYREDAIAQAEIYWAEQSEIQGCDYVWCNPNGISAWYTQLDQECYELFPELYC
jgi:hypothetical protein